MIPCHLCGKDSGAHWVAGYVPAPDNQKMALCAEHDTPEHRRELYEAWRASMEESIGTAAKNAAYFATRGALRMLSIHFTAGGSLVLPCLEVAVTEHDALKVTAPDGSLSFFPLRQIRRYDLAPALQQDR
jgi:hypothetical protein